MLGGEATIKVYQGISARESGMCSDVDNSSTYWFVATLPRKLLVAMTFDRSEIGFTEAKPAIFSDSLRFYLGNKIIFKYVITFTLISLVLFGSVFALIGGIAFLSLPRWSDLLARYSVPFAGGVLLTVALIGLLPESVELIGDTTFTITLVTFLIIYVFENLFLVCITMMMRTNTTTLQKRSAWFVMVGDTIHNFIDGVAIAAAFSITPGLGALTAVSTFLHEVPHEIGDFGVLLKAHWSKRSIIATNVISACASLVGAVLVFVLQPRTPWLEFYSPNFCRNIPLFRCEWLFTTCGKQLTKSKMIVALLLGVVTMMAVFDNSPRPLNSWRFRNFCVYWTTVEKFELCCSVQYLGFINS